MTRRRRDGRSRSGAGGGRGADATGECVVEIEPPAAEEEEISEAGEASQTTSLRRLFACVERVGEAKKACVLILIVGLILVVQFTDLFLHSGTPYASAAAAAAAAAEANDTLPDISRLVGGRGLAVEDLLRLSGRNGSRHPANLQGSLSDLFHYLSAVLRPSSSAPAAAATAAAGDD